MTDKIEAALKEAYRLGQVFIQEADSESYAQNRRAFKTQAQFDALVSETVALLREAAQPETALSKYREFTSDGEDEDPVERLRFFCAQAMSGQDWLDCERFFDDLKHRPTDEELRRDAERMKFAAEAPNLHGQVYLSCRLRGAAHQQALDLAHDAEKMYGPEQVSEADLHTILEEISDAIADEEKEHSND